MQKYLIQVFFILPNLLLIYAARYAGPVGFIAGLLQFVYFLVTETYFRKDKEFKKAGDTPDPRVIIGALSLILVPSLVRLLFPDIPKLEFSPLSILLISSMILGQFLRCWSMYVLDRFFTPGLRIDPDQKIIQEGPYSKIRHPGYLGNLLSMVPCGFCLVPHFGTFCFSFGVFVFVWTNRIATEENMIMSSALKEDYGKYKQKVPYRLIPFLF